MAKNVSTFTINFVISESKKAFYPATETDTTRYDSDKFWTLIWIRHHRFE